MNRGAWATPQTIGSGIRTEAAQRPPLRAPPRSEVSSLRPSDLQASASLLLVASVAVVGLWLSRLPSLLAWSAGQVLVAVAFVQWFCVMHECGHQTLFRTRLANRLVGHFAGVMALIPFASWRRIHALHHQWTGWQDLDPTTASLTPRPLGRAERALANLCWRWWVPLFSVLYRTTNYWNLARLRVLVESGTWRRIAANAGLLCLVYVVLIAWLGPLLVLRLVGLGLLLGLAFQDVFLLGQHTHVPQHLSRGEKVRRFKAHEQTAFTRSVMFPRWFSRWVLLGADAHELHHMYPRVPGHQLTRIEYSSPNVVNWWRWTLAARRVPADVFLFQNREQSGLDI